MYTLYWSPGSASQAPHAVLEELGVPYELARVDLKEPRPEAYLELNPTGRVPTLIDDGRPIYEAAAICMHLADRHPQKALAPALGTRERGLYYQWLLYLADTLQPTFMRYYRTQRYSVDPAHVPAIKERAVQELAEIWNRIDAALANRRYLASESLSAADIYLHMLYGWDPDAPGLRTRCPNLAAHHARVGARPAIARIQEMNG